MKGRKEVGGLGDKVCMAKKEGKVEGERSVRLADTVGSVLESDGKSIGR